MTSPISRRNVAMRLKWEQDFDRVAKGEMPPKNKRQPAAEEKTAWTSGAGRKACDPPSLECSSEEGRGPVRRLTRTEYENTVSDLFTSSAISKASSPMTR
jgi:hypothetical protein